MMEKMRKNMLRGKIISISMLKKFRCRSQTEIFPYTESPDRKNQPIRCDISADGNHGTSPIRKQGREFQGDICPIVESKKNSGRDVKDIQKRCCVPCHICGSEL